MSLLDELFNWLFGSDEPAVREKRKLKVFISFAIEDKRYKVFLVSQAKNEKSPFEFTDMSVKEPWSNNVWKRECRKRIRECDAMIVLLSKNTWHAGGTRWEIRCAREERIKLIGMHIKKDDKGAIPPELEGKRIIEWNWEKLERFLK